VVNVLARKLVRDLWRLRMQVLAVALVAAVGVANLVMSQATLGSLQASRERFYREYAFADAFADLRRAPESVAQRLAAIEGVARVDTRIAAFGRAELEGFHDPIRVQAISLPPRGELRLNRVHLRAGRLPEPGERAGLVVSDGFAEAHALRPGDALTLVLHGRRQRFAIVGVGASPEFVAQLDPGSIFPDAKRFAIVWMPRPALAAAMDLQGAFNSVTFALQPGARPERVLDRIDRELADYGGIGAIGREYQRSHRYLSEEFRQLATMARLFPAVFLGVAAFVLYVVLARLVARQREQIGTLKAFGYAPGELWRHYAGFALAVGAIGAVLGIALGLRLGSGMADLYRAFYRLPYLDFGVSFGVLLVAFAVSVGSALLGAIVPVLAAARLPPAEAMRAEVPALRVRPRGGVASRLPLSQAHRLILRNLQRRPWRSALTCIGLAAGTGILLMARFQDDSVDEMVHRQFRLTERHDVAVAFVEDRPPHALYELASLPGVLAVEPVQAVPVEVRFRSAVHRTAVLGLDRTHVLRRTLDGAGRPVEPPPGGVLVTDQLATMLGARVGDMLELETLDGHRRRVPLRLAGLTSEPFGVQAYLPPGALDALFDQDGRRSGALLAVDGARLPRVLAELDRRPWVASVDQRVLGIRNFYDGMADTILTFTLIATGFGIVITAGVVYSSARVALSERARDLASLRILGFTTEEVGYLLLGELALLTVLAVPLGFVLGRGLVELLVLGFDSDLMRISHYVSAQTYAFAGAITLITALLCGLAMRRRVERLDLIGVLKARD
jgi:putative ABC transport system permease protein